jgi:prevent-host-death family protein
MSETVVNIHEAKTHLSRLIERATEGETIIIAKAGKPKVILSPIPSKAPRIAGRFAGQIFIADDFDAPLPEEELNAWEDSPL